MSKTFTADFVEFTKQGKALLLTNIRTQDNIFVSNQGTVNFTKGFKNLNDLEQGDKIEFDAELKEVKFEFPKNVRVFKGKYDYSNRSRLENFFDIK